MSTFSLDLLLRLGVFSRILSLLHFLWQKLALLIITHWADLFFRDAQLWFRFNYLWIEGHDFLGTCGKDCSLVLGYSFQTSHMEVAALIGIVASSVGLHALMLVVIFKRIGAILEFVPNPKEFQFSHCLLLLESSMEWLDLSVHWHLEMGVIRLVQLLSVVEVFLYLSLLWLLI